MVLNIRTESNSIVVRTDSRDDAFVAMSSSEVANDVAMKLVLVLLRIGDHIICIKKVPCYFINCKGFGEALGSRLKIGDADDADFITRFWRETAFLFESNSAIIINILRHDCGEIGARVMFVFGKMEGAFLRFMLVEDLIEKRS